MKNSGRARGVVIVCLLLVLLLTAAWYWFNRRSVGQSETNPPSVQSSTTEKTPSGAKTQPQKITQSIPSPKVIDLDNLKNDAKTQALMDQRKQEYGVNAGVDAIVKPDESITVGGITVPMSEILEKIRIKKGDVIEKNIEETPEQRETRLRELFYKRLAQAEKEYHRLEKQLNNPDIRSNPELYEKYSRRLAKLKKTMELYDRLKALNTSIDTARRQLEDLSGAEREAAMVRLKSMLAEKKTLENELKSLVMPSGGVEAYGIYVVRPGDNIWNIHFLFLKDYFARKGITLSPQSDEPDRRGYSSGVGKILKFSETMVYIYNIRQHKLDVDLNLIHPRSKIVVFNMAEALSLLDQIDYRNVKQIKFDGETLWIPAEQ
jgi:hypothetical protein